MSQDSLTNVWQTMQDKHVHQEKMGVGFCFQGTATRRMQTLHIQAGLLGWNKECPILEVGSASWQTPSAVEVPVKNSRNDAHPPAMRWHAT